MARYIDVDEMEGYLIEEGQMHPKRYGFKLGEFIRFKPSEVAEIVRRCMPTADVKPVVRGEWEKHRETFCSWNCSVCKENVVAMPERMGCPLYKYCPNCGADMRGKKDEVD